MASNTMTLQDEDGDYPDWIELFNPGEESVDLAGYGLSDDPDDPYKWVFPSFILNPVEYLLIFTSGKNRSRAVKHWETVIDWGHIWRYGAFTYNPQSSWTTLDYDDSGWGEGPSGFGYGDGDDATVVEGVRTVFIRTKFTVEDPGNIEGAFFHADYDDGFIAYINGQEIVRANMNGEPGTIPLWYQTAAADHEAGESEAFEVENIRSILLKGDNVLVVRVHNIRKDSSDLTIIPFLTLGMKTTPAGSRGISEHLDFQGFNLHTGFKVSRDGETILLTNPSGIVVDSVETVAVPSDYSFGRNRTEAVTG